MKPIDRLKAYIDHKDISLNSFDKSIGTSNGYIGKQIKNGASPGADILQKISSIYTDLNLHWLITGEDEMLLSKNKSYISQVNNQTVSEPKVSEQCQGCKQKETRIKELTEFNEMLMKQISEAQKDKEVYRNLLSNMPEAVPSKKQAS